jgi:hypothetical protein
MSEEMKYLKQSYLADMIRKTVNAIIQQSAQVLWKYKVQLSNV